jgi:hypothetical protein
VPVTRSRAARLERLAERLARPDGLALPAGPVWTWPAAELERLARLIDTGGAIRRAVWSRLADADLEWIVAAWGSDAGPEGTADEVRPP